MRLILTLCLILLALPLRADPARDAAIAAWLADDATALPALRDLAVGGDALAAAFLATQLVKPVRSPWVRALTDAERQKFAQAVAEGAAPQDDPDRLVWLAAQAESGEDFLKATEFYLKAGDQSAARRTTARAVAQAGGDDKTRRADVLILDQRLAIPTGLRALLWMSAATALANDREDTQARTVVDEGIGAPDTLGKRAFLAFGCTTIGESRMPQFMQDVNSAALGGDAGVEPKITRLAVAFVEPLLMAAPEARLHAAICHRECPGDVSGCVRGLWTATLGYWGGTYAGFSPLDALIPTDRWVDSPRAQPNLLRYPVSRGKKWVKLLRTLTYPSPGAQCALALALADPAE